MGLMDEVIRSIDKLGFKHPTPIQRRAIPSILTGVDCVAMARTGSGKTAAFAIPTINRLAKHSEVVGVRAIVLSPTRELAMQTCKVFQLLSRYTDLRIALIVGGHSMEGQFDRLMNNPDIIIATPGRLIHHLEQEGTFSLDRVEMLIMDEADRLFELGFSEQIESILKSCPTNRQALLFSATLPSQLVRFAKAGLQSPEFVRLDSECSLSDDLDIYMAFTRNEAKSAALISVIRSLRTIQNDPKSLKKTIVFVATRHHVDFLGQLVSKSNVAKCALIYGSMEQQVRSAALSRFRSGLASVLIVTDVAARGIDIPDVDNVIHYDFPCSPKLFIHRSGRTARAGRSGLCISIVTASDMPYLMDLMMFIGSRLELSGTATKPLEDAAPVDDMIVEIDGEETSGRSQESSEPIEVGGIPYIDEDVEMVGRMIEEDTDLQSGKKSMEFSMIPYFKTRPSASKQAVRQSRDFIDAQCGGQQRLLSSPLSLFKSLIVPGSSVVTSVDESSREDILNALRGFRPSQAVHSTVGNIVKTDTRKALEERLYGSRRAREVARQILEGGEVSHGEESEESDDWVIETQKAVCTPRKKDFKSKEFFHHVSAPTESKRDDRNELEQYRLDLVPETNEEMSKVRYGKKWDSRKMNYVTVRIGSDGKAIKEKRNESGKKMTKKDLEKGKNLYREWAKKTKKSIQRTGEVESSSVAQKFKQTRSSETKKNQREEALAAPKSVSSKQYHGEVPWQYLTNKQKRLESRKLKSGAVTSRGNERKADTLKTPQSIAKARQLKSTRQILQNPKKRKEFHKTSKESYKQKQDKRIQAKSAPGRSWAKGQKPLGRR
jgi:ATP-dependent RNA helicase DDX54/DBP10